MLEIAFAKPALPRTGGLVLLVGEDTAPTALRQQADEAAGGAVSRAIQIGEFKAAKGKTCLLLAPAWREEPGPSRVLLAGLGKAAELTPHAIEEAGGAAAAALGMEAAASVDATGLTGAQAASLALGAVLRAYRFDRYRTKEKPEDRPKLAKLTILTDGLPAARAEWDRIKGVAAGVILTRDLVSEPANVLTPAEMADRCAPLAELGVEVQTLGPKELGKLGFGALLGVSEGSVNEPRMVVMEWNGLGRAKGGKKARPRPVVFVGKGVTFDTGGISIKPAGGMEDMKWDMAGAGAVIGLMAALAGRKARVRAIGLVGLVENMPSGSAQRPGDVVTSASGQTIEVINTDAEGRLVLADVLWHAQETYDPVFMVDLATLTGAIVVGLGHEHAGLFSNDDALAERLSAAGKASGEKVWRMPLHEEYDKQIKSDIADMKNVGGRPAGACTAAMFLQRFVNGKPWAHLDIAGTAWSSKDTAFTPKGATAFGVRLLDRLVAEHYEAP